jgi:hypothetical protein
MWLGVMHYTEAADGLDADSAILVAYEPERVFTVGLPVKTVPMMIRMLRASAGARGADWRPRCRACGSELEVPPLDGPEVRCASA